MCLTTGFCSIALICCFAVMHRTRRPRIHQIQSVWRQTWVWSPAEAYSPAVEVCVMCVWCVFGSAASSKTISGLLEFDSKTHAVEVLTVLNHYQIRIPSESPDQQISDYTDKCLLYIIIYLFNCYIGSTEYISHLWNIFWMIVPSQL